MRLQADYNDAFNGVLSENVSKFCDYDFDFILDSNEIKKFINSFQKNEFADKLFYVENYILQLRKFIKTLETTPETVFEKDKNDNEQCYSNYNLITYSNKSEISEFISMGYTTETLLNEMSSDLSSLRKSKDILQDKFIIFYDILEKYIEANIETSTSLEKFLLRGSLGGFKKFPKEKSLFSQNDLKGFFSDINLYFNFSKKLEGVPAEISPVISSRLMLKCESIINQDKTYKRIIEDLADVVNVSPKQLLIIDRELKNESIPLPNVQGDLEPKEISTEIHYFYFVDRPEFTDFLKDKANINGERPVMSHKRQEQYFHVFNTLQNDDFNGFDKYLEILVSHTANETEVHYDDFYKAANSGILKIIETAVSNFEYVYINNTNSLWHCTQKLKARKYLLSSKNEA